MNFMKRTLSLTLSIALIFCITLTCSAAEANNASGSEDITTKRYYFYMPETWKSQYTDTAGIYWWDGTNPCSSWPGYKAYESEVKNVYYYDVPEDVTVIIWNNFLDGGVDPEAEIYSWATQTVNICSEFYFPDEVDVYPNGVESFDGMIYVTNLQSFCCEYKARTQYEGEWYYYYGNGEYGLTPEKGEVFCKYSYLEEPLVPGEYAIYDINGDGNITIKDATDIQKYCAHLIELDESQIKRTNAWVYDWDGNFLGYDVTVKNATQIQKFVSHLIYNHGDGGR